MAEVVKTVFFLVAKVLLLWMSSTKGQTVTVLLDAYSLTSTLTDNPSTLPLGTTVILTCRTAGIPQGTDYSYTWSCPGEPSCNIGQGRNPNRKTYEDRLVLHILSTADTGTYTCSVRLATGEVLGMDQLEIVVEGGLVLHHGLNLIAYNELITDVQDITSDGITSISCTTTDQPQWRGPNGEITSNDTSLPLYVVPSSNTAILVINSNNINNFTNAELTCNTTQHTASVNLYFGPGGTLGTPQLSGQSNGAYTQFNLCGSTTEMPLADRYIFSYERQDLNVPLQVEYQEVEGRTRGFYYKTFVCTRSDVRDSTMGCRRQAVQWCTKLRNHFSTTRTSSLCPKIPDCDENIHWWSRAQLDTTKRNQCIPTSTTTPTPTTVTTTSFTVSPPTSNQVVAVAGGVVGVLTATAVTTTLLVLVVGCAVWRRHRRTKPQPQPAYSTAEGRLYDTVQERVYDTADKEEGEGTTYKNSSAATGEHYDYVDQDHNQPQPHSPPQPPTGGGLARNTTTSSLYQTINTSALQEGASSLSQHYQPLQTTTDSSLQEGTSSQFQHYQPLQTTTDSSLQEGTSSQSQHYQPLQTNTDSPLQEGTSSQSQHYQPLQINTDSPLQEGTSSQSQHYQPLQTSTDGDHTHTYTPLNRRSDKGVQQEETGPGGESSPPEETTSTLSSPEESSGHYTALQTSTMDSHHYQRPGLTQH